MNWRFWQRHRRDDELDEEIAHDLWLEAEERTASGLSRADAELASRRDFGNVALIKEAVREAWTWRSLEILAQDLRYAVRTLGRSRGFAATAIATLALGVGVNSATFTIFDQIAFRPLPVKDGSRIVSIYETFRGRFDRNMHGNIHMVSYPEFVRYQTGNQVFADVAAYADVRRLTVAGVQPEAVSGLLVTDRYFSVLGASVALGRTFRGGEASTPQTEAVLSDGYWQRRFGGDPEILGKAIRLNQTVFTIVGVIAPGFVGTTTSTPDVWLPLSAQPLVMADLPPGEPQNFIAAANLSWLSVVGKLKPHVTPTEARTDLGFLASQMDRGYPGRVTEVTVFPSTFLSNPDARPVVLIGGSLALLAVGLVLFVACANVANLLLARATARQREIAVRLSIGASRARVVRQLLTESSVLALAGGGLGLFLGQWTLDGGRRLVGLQNIDLSLDRNVLAYTLLLSVVTSVMFGLVPALQATTPNLSSALKDEGAMPGLSMHKITLRSRLIIAQVAVCCVFLVGAGLLVRGLINLNTLDPGFHVRNVFVTDVDLPFAREDKTRATVFYRELLSRIDAQTGGQSALAAVPPFHGVRIVQAAALGDATDAQHEVNSNIVSRNYFDVMGIRLFQGRTFTEAEADRGDPVAVVSEGMAKAYWPDQNPIGKRFRYGAPGRMQSAEVVGVVNDVRSIHIASVDGPLFYLAADPGDALKVITRSAVPAPLSKIIQAIVRDLNPAGLTSVRTLDDALQHETSPSRVAAASAVLLGGLALLLAAVGIYGMTAYVISQRTNEIGVRLALGARRSIILRWTVSETMRPVVVGIAVGLPLAAIASKAASRLLLGVHPFDPLAFVAVTAFLGTVGLIASVVPAGRAMRVDPAVSLRHG